MTAIETERLILRDFTPADGDMLYRYLSDPETVWFEPYPPLSREEASREAARRAGDPAFVAVCLKGGELIGNLYLSPEENGRRELGYVFNRAFWRRGLASEAARALISAAFSAGAREIVAECAAQNEASWRLLERLAFRLESETPRALYFKRNPDGSPAWLDARRYVLARGEYTEST